MTGPFKNGLLRRFDQGAIARLQLRRVLLAARQEIETSGQHVDQIVFIEEGIASVTTPFKDGVHVEIALAGSESVLGASALIGVKKSLNTVYMNVAGYGYSTRTLLAEEEYKRCGAFQNLILHYHQALFVESAQTAGCNARHSVQQRLARCLLLCSDRNDGQILPFSHEDLAEMIGARRTTITVAAGDLRNRGLIEYKRGKIEVLNRKALEHVACECYAVVRNSLKDFAGYDPGARSNVPPMQSV
jgi:CRP-like cAMP-binding protein